MDNRSLEVNVTKDGVIFKPIPVGKKEYSLRELVREMTSQNGHSEIDFGHPMGKELI